MQKPPRGQERQNLQRKRAKLVKELAYEDGRHERGEQNRLVASQ